MTLTHFGSSIADTGNGIFDVLLGKTGMHGDVEFPFVEEFTGFGALIGIIAHAFETGVHLFTWAMEWFVMILLFPVGLV